MKKLFTFIASVALPLVAGFIGSLVTTPNIPTWYAALEKPVFNPPNWVFGPAWTILYILMGISMYLVWISVTDHSKQRAFLWYGLQLVLNLAWSLVFFGLQAPLGALFVILALVASLICTIRTFRPISRPAAVLLLPYFAWVLFATVLNGAIVVLN